MLTPEQQTAVDWVNDNEANLSDWHRVIWDFHEPAWREYKSAAWYVERLRAEGFEVEEGSATMPTAFCATWGANGGANGGESGPVIGSYAEYDAVPGNSQQAVPYQAPREGVHRWAAGHTDPHSGLGMGALGGILAAKAAMEKHGIAGRLKFFGEPAEKVCGSKPVHAAHGYFDDIDAAISFHPAYAPAMSNTCVWDTHCGCYWSKVYTFECSEPETWAGMGAAGQGGSHTQARAPGAIDAVCLMYTTTKYTKEAMLPHTGTWTLNEAILAAGQATSDNLPPRFSQIQYAWRCPTLEMAERITEVLDRNAEHVAGICHCEVSSDWVTKTRVGLANHVMAEVTYANLELTGPPVFGDEVKAFGREIQKNLGLEPMDEPILSGLDELISPQDAEAVLKQVLPPWQRNYTSDDYVDYTWHAPTVRLFIGRPKLEPPEPGYQYPAWVSNALGGYAPAIDPMVFAAARCIGATTIDLLTDASLIERAKAEFEERTGGGIGGSKWVAPLLPSDFEAPIHYRWPEYVTTSRGDEWWLPEKA